MVDTPEQPIVARLTQFRVMIGVISLIANLGLTRHGGE